MDFTEYIAGHRERRAAERASYAERALAARQAAERVAALLAREFAAGRVVLFGSLAAGRFGARSDIDVAVEGVDPGRFFAAAAAAQREAEPFDIDLVPIEAATPLLRSHVDAEGVVLHGD